MIKTKCSNPTRILVPPGIGDIYWVTVKLASFIKKEGLDAPELTVVSYHDSLNSHLRGIPFLEMFPWISIGDPQCVENADNLKHIWNEAYSGPGRSIFPDIMGYDYLMAYNGCINSGGYIETADEYDCEWIPRLILPPAITSAYDSKFMLCFFPFIGTYQAHEKDFPVPLIADTINQFTKSTGFLPVFIGGVTEQLMDTKRLELLALVPNAVDLVGRTPLNEVFGLMQGCQMLFGYHSGIPNIGTALGKKSVLLWDDRFPESTSYACMPPWVRQTTYHAVLTKNLTVDTCLKRMYTTLET